MSLNVEQTKQAIRAMGLSVIRKDGTWRINYRNSDDSFAGEATARYTTDNDDALAIARAMVSHSDAIYVSSY
jgi:hypothetical protein